MASLVGDTKKIFFSSSSIDYIVICCEKTGVQFYSTQIGIANDVILALRLRSYMD